MARQPRLSIPAVVHLVRQRGHNGGAIVRDEADIDRLLQVLREAALSHGVSLHAYAVTDSELRLLATPDTATGLSATLQAVGRRYAAGFNRRHGRSGSLWDGRFQSALIEDGASTLLALRQIDAIATDAGAAVRTDGTAQNPLPAGPMRVAPLSRSSAAHRTAGRRDVSLVDPPVYWQLGNTPFERESRYRQLLAEALPAQAEVAFGRALQGAWAVGSAAFLASLAQTTARPLVPRPRGRPRRPV